MKKLSLSNHSIHKIQSLIHYIRGEGVMFDHDLAELYGVKTKALIQAVKRNEKRFPSDFMFQLDEEEFQDLRSQIVTSKWGGRRYMPYAFTQTGVAMLSSVLKSERAIAANIMIMRVFVQLSQIINSYKAVIKKMEEMGEKNDKKFRIIFEAMRRHNLIGHDPEN